jgi:hypothetical protein
MMTLSNRNLPDFLAGLEDSHARLDLREEAPTWYSFSSTKIVILLGALKPRFRMGAKDCFGFSNPPTIDLIILI